MDTLSLYNIAILLGSILWGTIVGIVPGIGIIVSILIFYPLLLTFDLFQLLLAYIAVFTASQFSGSIISTTIGVPGESSSLPAVKEGNALFNRGQGSLAISGAALGSVFGSLVACFAAVILLPYGIFLIKNFYSNNIQLAIFVFVCFFILFINKDFFTNVLLLLFGMLLSSIGYMLVPPGLFLSEYIPYDQYPDLVEGLPTFPVICALFVIPILARNWNIRTKHDSNINEKLHALPVVVHLKEYGKNFTAGIRGSIIGSISGLVPHLTNILASNLSYVVERKLGLWKKTYRSDGDMPSLVSAETANNSAAFTSLMPFILIGIPISTSEALLLDIIYRSNFYINYETFVETGLFADLVLWFIVANVLAFILAWPLVRQVNLLYSVPLQLTFAVTGVILLVLIGYVGAEAYQMEYYYTVFLCLAPIGYLLRNTDTIVLVIGFILQDKIFAALYRAITLWSI